MNLFPMFTRECEQAIAALKAEKAAVEGWCKSSTKITEIISAQIPASDRTGLRFWKPQDELKKIVTLERSKPADKGKSIFHPQKATKKAKLKVSSNLHKCPTTTKADKTAKVKMNASKAEKVTKAEKPTKVNNTTKIKKLTKVKATSEVESSSVVKIVEPSISTNPKGPIEKTKRPAHLIQGIERSISDFWWKWKRIYPRVWCPQQWDNQLQKSTYVDGLKHNLLSISQLCDKDYEVRFSKKACSVVNENGKLALSGHSKENVYVIDMDSSTTEKVCFLSNASSDVNWLWHKRLSHLNFKTLNSLSTKELVSGPPQHSYAKESLCSACEKGKKTKASLKSKQVSSVTSPIQVLHIDLFVLVNIQSIAGKKYTLNMEVLNNLTVRSTRSDHGTEFKNSSLNNFFENKGISHNFSSVRTPQQNGVTERRNRTIIEVARSMLNDSHLLTQFWAEAVNTACFTQNRSLIVQRFGKTAYELSHGRKPSISFLHIFGFQRFILNNKDLLRKFDPKADDGIFLGYSSISKACRLIADEHQAFSSVNIPIVDPTLEVSDLTPAQRWTKDHPIDQILGDPNAGIQTRQSTGNICLFVNFISLIKPKKTNDTVRDPNWVSTMQEELTKFTRNKVWNLVPRPSNKTVIGTKWVFRNKLDEHGTVTCNKARLVAQGYRQEEGIDYDETLPLWLGSKQFDSS
ncbi:hypothetical protein L6452_18513 [Arctium lappa]|uniref:Uncharacterized protein n=1 Tax=Arctium lappa TaxID=4217 RepID=A0ACB9C685_ARCLA|nr:hypothetical protein L6452_18513 [Arctium lappa]